MSYRKPLHLTLLYSVPFVLVLSILMFSLMAWSIKKHRNEQITGLVETGRVLSRQILIRIKDSKKQDPLFSGEGSEISNTGGYGFRVISNPSGLKTGKNLLEKLGAAQETYAFIERKGVRFFQFVKKITKPESLKGAVLVVDIPADISDNIHHAKVAREIVSFIIVGMFSMVFVIFTSWRLSRKISFGIGREVEEKRLKALIELAGATAHEIRQPLSIIICYSELLNEMKNKEGPASEELEIIKEQCIRMDEITQKMLNITHYSTIEYTDGIMIFDIHAQGAKSGSN